MKELQIEQMNDQTQEISGSIVQQNLNMTSNILFKGSLLGVISGIIMGVLLKIIEAATDQKVYTLLLNVDFIPILGEIKWPEMVEFIFHLVVSVLLGLIFYYLSEKWGLNFWQRLGLSSALTLPALFLYFPLSLLAQKEVPAIDNWEAILYWSGAHFLFALSLSQLFPRVSSWKI
ncbi:MAG: hypothetical protein ACQEUT_05690 [Bacillota bacterium]